MQGNTIGSGCGAVAGGKTDRLGGGLTVPARGKPTLIGGGTPGAGHILASGGSGGGSTGNVPEPETYAITLAGMALLGLLRRRRKAAAA
jgi:hypothetical protein